MEILCCWYVDVACIASMLYALELHAIISGHVARRFGGVERRYAIRPGSLGIRSICFEASLCSVGRCLGARTMLPVQVP